MTEEREALKAIKRMLERIEALIEKIAITVGVSVGDHNHDPIVGDNNDADDTA